MKGLAVCRYGDAEQFSSHPIPGHAVTGDLTARMLGPADYSLWLVELTVAAGAEIRFPAVHGDEALHVRSGAIEVGGRTCPEGGTIVVESAASPVLRANEPTVLLHMGPSEPTRHEPSTDGSTLHVVGPDGWLALSGPGRTSRYYADSTCETCDLTLLYTSRTEPYESPAHSHSVDELIHVVWGSIRLGAYTVEPGDTLAVAADQRYGFRADAGFGFLNYRSAASVQTVDRNDEPIVEGGLVNGFTYVPDGSVDIST